MSTFVAIALLSTLEIAAFSSASRGNEATRADLARAYVAFERALAARPPEGEARVRIQRAFDAATFEFFAGQGSAALASIAALTDELLPERSASQRALDALAFDVTPSSLARSGAVRVVARAAAPLGDVGEMHLQFSTPWSATQRRLAGLDATPFEHVIDVAPDRFPRGDTFEIRAAVGDAGGRLVARIRVGERTYDEERTSNRARLEALAVDGPPLEQAKAACIARNDLLRDVPSASSSAQFLADLPRLARDVATEIEALARGDDPYRRRAGDVWRTVQSGERSIAVRVFAPEEARKDAPLPLVVALHGAGGDENMFLEGYGAGCIAKLATERGFLVASPGIGLGAFGARDFDALVTALVYDYAVDRKRVFVVGHSMGAGAAFKLAEERATSLAGVVCIAGGPMAPNDGPIARTRVIAGEIDALVGLKRLQQGVDACRAKGAAIDLVVAKGAGHTLVVGEELPRAIEWLFAEAR